MTRIYAVTYSRYDKGANPVLPPDRSTDKTFPIAADEPRAIHKFHSSLILQNPTIASYHISGISLLSLESGQLVWHATTVRRPSLQEIAHQYAHLLGNGHEPQLPLASNQEIIGSDGTVYRASKMLERTLEKIASND